VRFEVGGLKRIREDVRQQRILNPEVQVGGGCVGSGFLSESGLLNANIRMPPER